jgi:hypothetical protein
MPATRLLAVLSEAITAAAPAARERKVLGEREPDLVAFDRPDPDALDNTAPRRFYSVLLEGEVRGDAVLEEDVGEFGPLGERGR